MRDAVRCGEDVPGVDDGSAAAVPHPLSLGVVIVVEAEEGQEGELTGRRVLAVQDVAGVQAQAAVLLVRAPGPQAL